MITRTMTRKGHLSIEPGYEAQTLRNCLYLLRKHCEGGSRDGATLQERLGLPSKEEVQQATAGLHRDSWWPTRMGPEGVLEFLEAGFLDCVSDDYKRWGLTRNEVAKWARRNPKVVIQSAKRVYPDREDSLDRCTCYNLVENSHRFTVI